MASTTVTSALFVPSTQQSAPPSVTTVRTLTSLAIPHANVMLQNVVPGSAWVVLRASDKTVLDSGVASSSMVLSKPIERWADFNVIVRVRGASTEPKYLPWESQATLTGAGATLWVSQVQDTIADATSY